MECYKTNDKILNINVLYPRKKSSGRFHPFPENREESSESLTVDLPPLHVFNPRTESCYTGVFLR